MNAMRWIFAAQGLAIVSSIATAGIIAQPQPAVQTIPFPNDYRSWQHVKSIVVGSEHRSFASRGGFHHYYANAKAVEGYRTGRFPNGSVIVDEGVLTEDGIGPAKGIVMEGDRRTVDVMVKHDKLYRDTGGWGFEHFEGSEAKGQLDVSRRTQCYECHAKSKDRDHVYSAIRVAKFATATATSATAAAGTGMNASGGMTASAGTSTGQADAQARHKMIAPGDLKWSPASPGIQIAILSGSLDTEGAHFVIRLKMADGTKVPPHWHPGDEHLTVLSGTFHMGLGERFDEAAATAMTSGAYVFVAKEVRHFAWATGETVVQLHGIGPFKTFMVTPPSTK